MSLIFSYWARSSLVLLIHCPLSSGSASRYSCRHTVIQCYLQECLSLRSPKPTENWILSKLNSWAAFSSQTKNKLKSLARCQECRLFWSREIGKAPLIKLDRTAWSIWQLPSSRRSESGCSSVDRWCLPAGSWPGNYCWGTGRPIHSCAREGRQTTRRFMSFSTQIGHSIPSEVSSSSKGWAVCWTRKSTHALNYRKTLTCMRGRLTETVSNCCCQEILLLKQAQTQPQGGDINNQWRGVKSWHQ